MAKGTVTAKDGFALADSGFIILSEAHRETQAHDGTYDCMTHLHGFLYCTARRDRFAEGVFSSARVKTLPPAEPDGNPAGRPEGLTPQEIVAA